jgi:alkylation response protein AidB-like acyl-CoA dehydrogenase
MDFTASEAQTDLAALSRRLLDKWSERTPRPATDIDRELWSALARAGILDAALPAAAGGGGFGLLEQCAIAGELGRAAAPVPFIDSIIGGGSAIAEFGGPEQIERYLLPVVRGDETIAVALGDDRHGFTATPTADGFRIDGRQLAVSAAAFADTVVIEADGVHAPGSGGAGLLLVPAAALNITGQQVTGGTDAADVTADAVTVGREARLGPPDGADWLRRRLTIGWCARQAGVLARALELTADYARTREQFGKPIGSFQAVRQRLADAYIDVEAAELTSVQAAWRESEDLPAELAIATAKFWAAEAGHRVAHTAVHVHGGVGIDLDHPTHRYFLAAERGEFELGGATAQLLTIGAALAADPA